MSAHNFPAQQEQADWVIPDPGPGKPIPSTRSGIVELEIGTGTEADNTVADPVKAGLHLIIVAAKSSGGTRGVKFASSVLAATDTRHGDFAAGEYSEFRSLRDGLGGYHWARTATNGVSWT